MISGSDQLTIVLVIPLHNNYRLLFFEDERSTHLLHSSGRSSNRTCRILFPSRLRLFPLLFRFLYPFSTSTFKNFSGGRAYLSWVKTKSETYPVLQQSANALLALFSERSWGKSNLPQHLMNVPYVMLVDFTFGYGSLLSLPMMSSAIWNAFIWWLRDALTILPSTSTVSAKAQAFKTIE